MTATRIARAIAVAGALCAVLALRVFVTFEPFRIKVVEQPIPSVEGTVRLPANRLGGFDRLQGPFAVIARIRHLSPDPEPFDIEIDGRIACTVRVRPGAARRVDCAWPHQWSPGAEHRVSIAGRPRDWTLEYLEVGTHHGATRAYDLLIVPAISSHYGPPGPFWIGTAFVVLTLVFALPVAGLPRPVRIGWTVLAAAVGLIFVLVFLSPLVSPFLVLLSATAFVRGVAVLAAPRLWLAGSAAVRRFSSRRRWPAAAAALAAVLVAAAYFNESHPRTGEWTGDSPLLAAERDHRVDVRRAAGGDIRRDKGDSEHAD